MTDHLNLEGSALSSQFVTDVYVGLFGREPENPMVIQQKIDMELNSSSFLRSILKSDEFLDLHQRNFAARIRGAALKCHVESEVDERTQELLFSRTVQQWTELGEHRPYWSVLSSERFEKETFNENSDEFWNSGEWVLGFLNQVELELGLTINSKSVLELGCGVARMTSYLVNRFEHVIGLDVSAGNLAIAREKIASLNPDDSNRIDLIQLETFEQLTRLPLVDLFLSIIVLQHNTPPVQAELLRLCLSRLKIEGVAIFQVVVAAAGYEFKSLEYLASPEKWIDMHCLPLAKIFEILSESGVKVLRIEPDTWACDFGLSMTVVGVKS